MTDLVVEIQQGKLMGKSNLDYKGGIYYSFQGIPYAKPPTGELRFKAPQPPEPWNNIRDCRTTASASISRHGIYQYKIGSESCLYLNIFTKKLPSKGDASSSKQLMPVLYWIHGGGFVCGSGDTDVYGPDYLMTGDVVLVTINFRLGILGFLSLEDPSLNIPGNNGLKDIVQGLKWVQKNIDAFNGDPGCVTIFGCSSGASTAHFLMLSPLANGLFHRVIMQSGTALNPRAYGYRSAKVIAKAMGLETENEAEILEVLKKLPAEEFQNIQDKIPYIPNMRPHGFIIENPCDEPTFLACHPMQLMLSGQHSTVPLLIGYTSKEGLFHEVKQLLKRKCFELFTDFEMKIPTYFQLEKGSDLSKQIAQKIKDFYFHGEDPTMDNMDNLFLYESDSLYYRGVHTTLKNYLKYSIFPTYFYRFSADTELNWIKQLAKVKRAGVPHLDDVAYLFNISFRSYKIKEGSIEDIMVQRMVKMWTNFAKTGNPTPEEDPLIGVTWKAAETGKHHFLEIDEKLTVGTNPDQERMEFWDEISCMCPAANNR